MRDSDRAPGWDRQAVMRIANEHYGSLDGMFAAHGWNAGDRVTSQIAPSLVVDAYRSVAQFVVDHDARTLPGLEEVLNDNEPDVWLTSFYGFAPRNWGFLGFTVPWMRDRFLRESRLGSLVVVYGAGGAAPTERGKILGIQQMSRRSGSAQEFMDPKAWADKQANPARRDKWNLAVQAVRAWKVTPETRPDITAFAPTTFTRGRAQVIGAMGLRVTADEARNLISLDLQEVTVFGGPAIDDCIAGPAAEILRPSKAGPVSSSGHWSREAEGPKHLYILKLDGVCDHFMGQPVGDKLVVKVGMSRSPTTRCDDHNRVLPACALTWNVARTTAANDGAPFPGSRPALAGEQAMKDYLNRKGRSLGGEFFLATHDQIDEAWRIGVTAAGGKATT